MKLRALIVDDMQLARKRIRRHLEADPEIEIAGECASGRTAIEAVRTLEPDLLFLDVQMPEVGGFEVLEAVGADAVPAVIFVTAYDEFALRAFEVHALDYLLKPFDAERFQAALARAKRQVAATRGAGVDDRLRQLLEEVRGESKYLRRLAIRTKERTVFVTIDDVDYIEAAGNYLRLHAGKDAHLTRDRLSVLEPKLDPRVFVRIHRSTIVNVTRVAEMHPLFNGDQLLVLKGGTRLTVSRTFRDRLVTALEAT